MNNVITLQIGGAIDLNLVTTPKGKVRVTTRYQYLWVTAEGNMAYTLPYGYWIEVQISYVDASGNPANVDGEVTWESSHPNIATVEPDTEDSAICRITAVDETGDCQVTARADADLGSGTREIVTLFDLHVVAGEAVAGTINVVGEAHPS